MPEQPNPNEYMIRGQKMRFPPGYSKDYILEQLNGRMANGDPKSLKPISIVELVPLNPNLPEHAIPDEPGWGDTGISILRTGARQGAKIGGTALAAAAGAPAIPAAVAGLGAGAVIDAVGQKLQGQHRPTSLSADAGLVEEGGIGDYAMSAIENLGIDAAFTGAFKGLGKVGKMVLGKPASPVEFLEQGGAPLSRGQANPKGWRNAIEDIFAPTQKADLLSRQADAGKNKIFDIAGLARTSSGEIPTSEAVGGVIKKKIQDSYTGIKKFVDQRRDLILRDLPEEEVIVPGAIATFGKTLRSLGGSPLTQTTEKIAGPIQPQQTLAWAKEFIRKNDGNADKAGMLEQAKELLAAAKDGRPLPFTEALNKFWSSEVSQSSKGLLPSSAALDGEKAAFRDAIESDITESIANWGVRPDKLANVQAAWSQIRQGVRAKINTFDSSNGLLELIETSDKSTLSPLLRILQDPIRLKNAIATGSMATPETGKIVSKSAKADFGALYLKSKLDDAWDHANNRFVGAKLRDIFKSDAEKEIQSTLFNAKQRSELANVFEVLGNTQGMRPGSQIAMTRGGVLFNAAVLGNVLGNLVGSGTLGSGAGIIGVEIGMAGLSRMMIEKPQIARQISNLAQGRPLTMPLREYGAEIGASLMNGAMGTLQLRDGTKVPGRWEKGKFIPND